MTTTLRLLPALALGAALLVAAPDARAQQVDLSAASSLAPALVQVGDDATFTLDVTNPSGSNASPVTMALVLPAGVDYVSSSEGSYDAATRTWSRTEQVKKNRTETYTVTVRGAAPGTYDLTGTATYADDPNASNNASTQTLTVPSPPAAGDPLCFAVADAGGANGGNDWLLVGDRVVGTQATVGTGLGTSTVEAIAYWPGTHTLYAADAGTLGTVDAFGTGEFSARGGFGTGGGSAGDIVFDDADGLAFDPFSGVLWASHRREGDPNADDLLFQVDPATGAHVPDAFGPGVDYLVVPTDAAVGQPDLDDIAVSAWDGRLYAIANNGGATDRLVAIDKATGAVTDVGPLGQGDMEGLGFDPFGTLYGTTGSVASTNANSLFTVDPTTGTASLVAGLVDGTDHEATDCLTDGVNTISGRTFLDRDGSGAYSGPGGPDAPEPGAWVTLFRDTDGDGVVSDGDVAVDSVQTGADGAYAFTVAATGDFVVAAEDLAGAAGGAWTTAESHPAQFTGFGEAATGLDMGYTTSADVTLSVSVDDPAPAVGDVVTFTVTVLNEGLVDATGVEVLAPFYDRPGIVEIVAATPGVGSYDGTVWTVGTLQAKGGMGRARKVPVTLTVQVRVLQDATRSIAQAEVSAMDQPDADSDPLNGVTSEDDYGTADIAVGGSSTAGEGGLESNGSMARALASVLQARRARRAADADAGVARSPVLLADVLAGAPLRGGSILGVLPLTGPAGSVAHEVSPTDLLPVTNALDVAAADYVRPDGRRVGAVFATTTAPREVYEHTKPVCDRLRGGVLEGVERVTVAGHPFVLARIAQADGSVDYAISFAVYEGPGGTTVDSRFLISDYDTAAMAPEAEVLNLQVWGPSRAYAAALARAALDAAAGGPVRFRNTVEAPPALPRVFVQGGRYDGGRLVLDLYNATGATSLRLSGGAITRAEGAAPEPFDRVVDVPAGTPRNATVSVAVETGPLFDAVFFVEAEPGAAPDRLYLADGTWGVALDPRSEAAELDRFEVLPEPDAPEPTGGRRVERDARASGTMDSWATLYRTLRSGSQPADLTAFRFVEFVASGSGSAHLLLQQAAIATSDHYGRTVALTPEPRTHRVYFADPHLADGSRGFSGAGVTALSLTQRADGPAPFDIAVSDVRFGGGDGEPDVAEAALLPPAPNPTSHRARIRFDLPDEGQAVLRVFDVLGREVARLADGARSAGRHTADLDARGLAPGLYVVRLDHGGRALTRPLTVVR